MAEKILFADDDPLVARIYRDKLSAAGFNVLVAEDGVLAMKLLIEFKPDLVVLDLLMPKLNGADVLKFIRGHPELKSTRVIIFSNSFLAALVEQVGDLGAEKMLPKSSATPALLIELIHTTLAERASAAGATAVKKDQPAENPTAPRLRILNDSSPAAIAEKKDEQFRASVQVEFVKHLPRVLADIRQLARNLLTAANLTVEMQAVEDLSRKVGFLTQMASMAGCAELAQLASALELLFFHLHEKQAPVADSCRNTIADTVAFLTQHLEQFNPALAQSRLAEKVLVVDDDLVINRGIVYALTHAQLAATGVASPMEAFEKLRQESYGLILLDVELPGMDGIALCERIRSLEPNKRTPVIFITSHSDLKTRARSVLSGGNDFISKPILPIELTVKVITQLLKNRSSLAG
jgi:DNA-binding response OmpR family regulator